RGQSPMLCQATKLKQVFANTAACVFGIDARFYLSSSSSPTNSSIGIPAASDRRRSEFHIQKLRDVLAVLDRSRTAQDMDLPGFRRIPAL
ncbi:MAG: hypothetical protein ACLQDV_12145, partial [Candidatus Binataceae bacterium]